MDGDESFKNLGKVGETRPARYTGVLVLKICRTPQCQTLGFSLWFIYADMVKRSRYKSNRRVQIQENAKRTLVELQEVLFISIIRIAHMTPGPMADREIEAQSSRTKKKPTQADSNHMRPETGFLSVISRMMIENMNTKPTAPTNVMKASTSML